MRLPILTAIYLILINIVVDYYILRVIKKRVRSKIVGRIYLYLSILLPLSVVVVISLPRRSGSDLLLLFIMWALYTYLTINFPKYLFVIFDIISYIPRLWKAKRISIISKMGIGVSIALFLLMWWGALFNRFSVDINEVLIEIADLPKNFEGYKIIQISDLHVGAYRGDTTYIAKVVNEINKLNADAIVFTGDIVNRNTTELIPFVEILSKIKSKDGVYSVLGNHDYGDYSDWKTPEDKLNDQLMMQRLHKNMGWQLLLNETKYVYRKGDSIAIIGVENVGDPPFKVYGSLSNAYPLIGDSVVKILLTHNPIHWEQEIKDDEEKNIALTLSGHTHAMQIYLLGYSPSSMRYKYWAGLYSDESKKRKLYVNIGIGTVALPMRIGATPEITLITLTRSK